jgi:hypothetical protein
MLSQQHKVQNGSTHVADTGQQTYANGLITLEFVVLAVIEFWV